VASAFTLGLTIALGLFSPQALVYLIFITVGLLGAMVASREPSNSIGWLMCAGSLGAILLFLPMDYGYTALVVEHDSWPLGGVALWLNTWAWAPLLGMFVPLIAVRFPDGRVRPWWRPVDWLAIAGTAVFALSIALAPADALRGFLPLSQAGPYLLLAPAIQNPLGASLPAGFLAQVRLIGLVVIALGYVAAVASVVSRFRRACNDERLQLKWFAYAGVLIAVAVLYAVVAWIVLGQAVGDALLPLDAATFALPLAIGIAILRYHLYDIDLIINRTLVYVSLTAILGAVYVAVITFLQRLFISLSGQTSEATYVLTAFVVVAAFGPVKDLLQRQVDHRLGGATASAAMDRFRAEVDAIVSVMDADRLARRLVDEALAGFGARGAALYLDSSATAPLYRRGRLNGGATIEVDLRHDGEQLGRLVLGSRRGDLAYTEHDRDTLQAAADAVGEAMALARHFAQRALPKSR
jgi:hypothetical protein